VARLPLSPAQADGTVVEAYWLTDFPSSQVGPRSLFAMAKSRWEIEKPRFQRSQKPSWPRTYLSSPCQQSADHLAAACLALTIERLYRLRYLHRGSHPWRSSAELVLALWVNLFRPCSADTS